MREARPSNQHASQLPGGRGRGQCPSAPCNASLGAPPPRQLSPTQTLRGPHALAQRPVSCGAGRASTSVEPEQQCLKWWPRLGSRRVGRVGWRGMGGVAGDGSRWVGWLAGELVGWRAGGWGDVCVCGVCVVGGGGRRAGTHSNEWVRVCTSVHGVGAHVVCTRCVCTCFVYVHARAVRASACI